VRAAGFTPRTKLPAPPGTRAPRRKPRHDFYLHRCPICHQSRTARRVVRRWRCAACVAAGLPGELVVTRLKP
jgi:ribosomal protein L37AE/L43A